MAEPTVWCRLPSLILPLIIENTADLETLQHWCTATKQKESTLLHRVALRERYRSFTVDKKSLLCAFSQCMHRVGPYDPCTHNSSLQEERSYREISQHIKKLALDFSFPSVLDRDELVAFEDVEHTLATLISDTRIKEIEHDGILYQLWLDQITKIPTLQVLKVRHTPCRCSCTRNGREIFDPRPGFAWPVKLEWVGLRGMGSLKVLHVSQLLESEAADLGLAIRGLTNLEDLYVGASVKQKEDTTLINFAASFLKATNSPFSPGSSLKSLSLVDVKHTAILESEVIASFKPLANLERLYFDLPTSGFFTVNFLEIMNPDNLIDLTISISPMSSTNPRWEKLQALLIRHRATLQNLTFLNAWETYIDHDRDISCALISFMHLRQVYLAGLPYITPSQTEKYKSQQQKLMFRIFGKASNPQTWGPGMRHLRLDHVDLEELQINSLTHSDYGLEELKTIILRPMAEQVRDPLTGYCIRSLPYPFEPFGPDLPSDIGTLRESQIAQGIADQGLKSLRIIAVGRYKYWVQGNQPGISGRKIWFLRRALEDPEQEAEIFRVMDGDDWAFLADRSDCLAEYAPVEQVHEANRLVFRNVDFDRT